VLASKVDTNSFTHNLELETNRIPSYPDTLPATMKFAVATLATLPSASPASEFNIRVAANQLLGTKSSNPAEAQVTVHGLLRETTVEDLNIISKSIVAAYNSAYSATGYSFTALQTKTLVSFSHDKIGSTPRFFWPGCRWHPTDDALTDSNTETGHTTRSFEVVADISMPNNDDNTLRINDATILSARFTPSFWPGFRWFPNEDAIALNEHSPIPKIPKDSHIASKHEAFEKSFCTKLQNSGLANFANVNNCSFRLVNSPAGGGGEATQE
jgi:hypothetical protein